ncbi:MAG: hypothetical protein ACNI3C_09030 [Candidatus Marinarcus sp.]|uniref:hypothetical protein n=1 Tax=Candidatus Marinarcus sp. TaxID=3100987 RepID=UPI003B00B9D3
MRQEKSFFPDYHTKQMNDTFAYFNEFMNKSQSTKSFNLKKCIDNSIDILRPLLQNNHIMVCSSCQNIDVFSCESEMTLALLNILNNSFFELTKNETQKERYIHIESKRSENNSLKITIQDTRKLAPAISQTIFEQYDNTYENRNSFDMRLLISKKIIEQSLKGKLDVQIEPLVLNGKKIDSCKFTIELIESFLQ